MNLRLFICVVLLTTCSAFAQGSGQWDPCHLAHPRTDVTLKIALKGGQSVYREGEIIPLDLSFTSSAIAFLPLDSNSSAFCLSPQGNEPLQDYYLGLRPAASAAPGNLLGAEHNVEGTSYVVQVELNEWRSIPPGRYFLRVVNHAVAAASNEIKFQVITASQEWQSSQLASALAILDANRNPPTEAQHEQTAHAVRVLRFLGTEASTRELARRFWSHDQDRSRLFGTARPSFSFYQYERKQNYWDFKAGLMASPYRAIAIQELTATMNDPQHPPTRAMAETLALLEIQSNPKYPRFLAYDQIPKEEWEKQEREKSAAYVDLVAKLLRRE